MESGDPGFQLLALREAEQVSKQKRHFCESRNLEGQGGFTAVVAGPPS